MKPTTPGQRNEARGLKRLAATAAVVATLAAGALAISQVRDRENRGPTTEAAYQVPIPATDAELARLAGSPPMSALTYPHAH
jgi:hypothetical protein